MSNEIWFWIINIIDNYWVLLVLNSLLMTALITAVGLFSWIPKFFGSILIWSFFWALIALMHNSFSSNSSSWEISNYVVEILWKVCLGVWYVLQQLFDDEFFITEIWSWQWLEIPNSTDLKHLVIILLITLYWTLTGSKNSKKLYARTTNNVSSSVRGNLSPKFSKNLNRSADNGPVDYRALVDEESVRTLALSIVSSYQEGDTATLESAAAIFTYVKNTVTYVSDDIQYGGDYVATPQQTLKSKKGDCDDQAILTASLLSSVGIKNRMLLIGSDQNMWHLVTEFCIDLSMKETFIDLLDKFYNNLGNYPNPRKYLFFEEKDGIWLLADTTRDHIAEYESLMDQGYLYENEKGINWYNLDSVY